MIEQLRLRELLHYAPKTGVFTWLNPSKYHTEKRGLVAGCAATSKGKTYVLIGVDGRIEKAHRLAWVYIYGATPTTIDHINGDSTDNRIANLRDCTHTQNAQNHTRNTGPSGLPVGVRVAASTGRYQARITANKTVHHLGCFDSPEAASAAYTSARMRLHDAPSAS